MKRRPSFQAEKTARPPFRLTSICDEYSVISETRWSLPSRLFFLSLYVHELASPLKNRNDWHAVDLAQRHMNNAKTGSVDQYEFNARLPSPGDTGRIHRVVLQVSSTPPKVVLRGHPRADDGIVLPCVGRASCLPIRTVANIDLWRRQFRFILNEYCRDWSNMSDY